VEQYSRSFRMRPLQFAFQRPHGWNAPNPHQ
jgi:hypothetical protein